MDAPTGPYLINACLCEKVLTEQDGVQTLVRVVDQITHHESGPTAPQEMPPLQLPLFLFVNLKPGETRGSYQIVIQVERPDGTRKLIGQLPVAFQGGPDQGASLQVFMQAEYTLQGLYWFEVYWEQIEETKLLTKVPLRIIYLRTGGAAQQTGPPSSL